MTKKKQKPNPTDIVEHAFHMPITYAEQREFQAIAQRVLADTYLPVGYRFSTEKPKIVTHTNSYSHGVQTKEEWSILRQQER